MRPVLLTLCFTIPWCVAMVALGMPDWMKLGCPVVATLATLAALSSD